MALSDRISQWIRPNWANVLGATCLVGAGLSAPAVATVLDFGAALQELETGEEVEHVSADGGTMHVSCHNDGGGPDLCVIFDTSEPSGGDLDLGTPNEDFGGPGEGEGGKEGAEGENADELGNVLIIAESKDVEDPDDESGGGTIWLRFSHAGRLSMSIIDVDSDEEPPVFCLYHDGELVEEVEGDNPGDNSVQEIDLSEHGDIDAVKIVLEGSSAIADIQLDVIQVGVEAQTWSTMKHMYR